MGDNIKLQFQYLGKDVTVVVEDIDKANLIDLIIENWEKAARDNIETPEHPTFNYVFKMKHVSLLSDADLMKMFSNLPEKKEIYIWVGTVGKDSKVVQAARSLMSGKTPTEPISMDKSVAVEPKVIVRRSKLTPSKKKI